MIRNVAALAAFVLFAVGPATAQQVLPAVRGANPPMLPVRVPDAPPPAGEKPPTAQPTLPPEIHAEHGHATGEAAHEEHHAFEPEEEEEREAQLIGGFEYLFLKARRRTQDFAILDGVDNGRPEGLIESLNWEARSGVRARLGGRLPSGLEASFVYTYFHTSLDGGATAPANGILFATLTNPSTVSQVAAASASTSLNYNVFDGEIGQTLEPGERLRLRLFGGPRFARIDQNFTAFYNGIDANNDQVFSRLNLDAYGIRVGGDAHWKLTRWGLGVYGRSAASLLVGNYEVRLLEANNTGATVITNLAESYQKVIPVLELGLGVAWQWRCMRVSAGYEVTNWFGLVDLPDIVDDVHQGKYSRRVSDLSLDGLVIKAELNY